MKTRIEWADDPELDFLKDDHKAWICNCGSPLVAIWEASCALYETEPITTDGALTNHWRVECYAGHVLLLCQEIEDVDESGDTFPAPTVEQIVTQPNMAFAEDIAAWRQYNERGQHSE